MSRATFGPRPSVWGTRGSSFRPRKQPKMRINQRMDDLRKEKDIASSDVLFFKTKTGYQRWRPAKRYKADVPVCMQPLDGPITVYINRRGVAPTFKGEMGPVNSKPNKGPRPPAAHGLPAQSAGVPYFTHYGGAPWVEDGTPRGALGYPKDTEKKSKCRRMLELCCRCYKKDEEVMTGTGEAPRYDKGGGLRKDVYEEDGEAVGPHYEKGRGRESDVEDEFARGDGRASKVKKSGAGFGGDYDKGKAENYTEKELEGMEKSWGIFDQIVQKEIEKKQQQEEEERLRELLGDWEKDEDEDEEKDILVGEEDHVCLKKTKCIPRHCRIKMVGSKEIELSSSSSEDEDEDNKAVRPGASKRFTRFMSMQRESLPSPRAWPQREPLVPQTGGYGTSGAYGGAVAPSDGGRRGSLRNSCYEECRGNSDVERRKRRKRSTQGGVCYRDRQKQRSGECLRKKLCDPERSARHRAKGSKERREKDRCSAGKKRIERDRCSRGKYEKRWRRRSGDPPASCRRPNCVFSNRLTYPVELLPYSASHRHVVCNPEHPDYQQPTVSCPIKWKDLNMN